MKNYIQKLIDRFTRFNYSDSLTNEIHRWLLQNRHEDLKEEALRKVWNETEAKSDSRTEESLQQVLHRLQVSPVSRTYEMSVWRYAAAVAVLCVSIVSTFWLTKHYVEQPSVSMVEKYIRYGETGVINLPDGSVAHLNSGSYILYPDNFEGNTRVVHLIGEANFKVVKNPNKPFIVKSADVSVTALGTEFDVEAYPEEDEIVATLLNGKIKVETTMDTTSYILSPGEQVVYNKKTAQSQLVMAHLFDVTAWQRGEIIFRGCTAGEVFQQLERYYGITFRYNPNLFNEDKYNFKFKRNASMEDILEVLQIVIGNFDYQVGEHICYIKYRR